MDWAYLLIERLVGIALREARDRHYPVANRFAVLRLALESGADVRMVYFSASSRQFSERVVTPLRLAQEHAGGWYLRGFDHLRGAERTFKVGRIKDVAPVADLACIERPTPDHLRWPDLDVDLSIDSIDHPERYPLVSGAGAEVRESPEPE
jgi:predicted DNA-binding transcriptional regulator YafY